ncbi:MAG: choice-of-anchor tandem repeat GloVer-containing protein [Rhizomicrobium sp.]
MGILGGILAAAIFAHVNAAHATSFKVLYSFTGENDGGEPGPGSLVIDKEGNLYGATDLLNFYTAGTVFKLAPDGTETVLYIFSEGIGGFGPGGLTMDQKGDLYGGTFGGGSNGCGVVFEVSPSGQEKTVHDFAGPPDDGCIAQGTLIRDAKRQLFGTTSGGGKNRDGTVFEMTPRGTVTLLHSFKLGRKGNFPAAGVIMDTNGNFYGTNAHGGSKESGNAYELTPKGVETVLHTFKDSPKDGSEPLAGVIMNASGDLFGVTYYGGNPGCAADRGCGIVFEIAPGGRETVLHFFSGKHGDGANPEGGLISDNSGNLYGTTEYGGGRNACNGTYGCGTVFEIAPDGTETILHSFGNGNKGANPVAGLVADSSGNLYGTTQFGGTYGYGTVFEITP